MSSRKLLSECDNQKYHHCFNRLIQIDHSGLSTCEVLIRMFNVSTIIYIIQILNNLKFFLVHTHSHPGMLASGIAVSSFNITVYDFLFQF